MDAEGHSIDVYEIEAVHAIFVAVQDVAGRKIFVVYSGAVQSHHVLCQAVQYGGHGRGIAQVPKSQIFCFIDLAADVVAACEKWPVVDFDVCHRVGGIEAHGYETPGVFVGAPSLAASQVCVHQRINDGWRVKILDT